MPAPPKNGFVIKAPTFGWGNVGQNVDRVGDALRGPVASDDEIAQRSNAAQGLIARGSDASPVQHWTQGAARITDAIVGGLGMKKSRELEAQRRSAITDALTKYAGDPDAMERFGLEIGSSEVVAAANNARERAYRESERQYSRGRDALEDKRWQQNWDKQNTGYDEEIIKDSKGRPIGVARKDRATGDIEFQLDDGKWSQTPPAGTAQRGPEDPYKIINDINRTEEVKLAREGQSIFRAMTTHYQQAQKGDASADLALVMGLAKILDPGSIVRGPEGDQIRDTSKLPAWVATQLLYLTGQGSGTSLPPDTRNRIMQTAQDRYAATSQTANEAVAPTLAYAQAEGAAPGSLYVPPQQFDWTKQQPDGRTGYGGYQPLSPDENAKPKPPPKVGDILDNASTLAPGAEYTDTTTKKRYKVNPDGTHSEIRTTR